MPVVSIDPRTGETVEVVAEETPGSAVAEMCGKAAAAAPLLDAMGRQGRAALLRRCAEALNRHRSDVVRTADRETALGETRLNGELTRTCFQLDFLAEVVEEGSYLEASIDHAGDTPMGPQPDLRRMLVPIGPVAVFGASNFPLAFSVPGGDTASALAVGCPVIVKAHASHPATSQLCFELLSDGARLAGAPEDVLGLVHGLQAGADLVVAPQVRAAAFTGSLGGGKALVDLINNRPDPIPFYGELSSLNPLVVTPDAVEERAAEIGSGLADSVTLGAGQFCTKPGLVFVPHGEHGDELVDTMRTRMADVGQLVLLNDRIHTGYIAGVERLSALPNVRVVLNEPALRGRGFNVTPALFGAEAVSFPDALTEEVFGPVTVVVRYGNVAELREALTRLPASLTITLHTGRADGGLAAQLVADVPAPCGRIVFNGYPTGVAVSWAQHHGGPWPSSNSAHTSVGATAVRRFLRPVAWQGAPQALLPPELRDDGAPVPRRIDGRLLVDEQ